MGAIIIEVRYYREDDIASLSGKTIFFSSLERAFSSPFVLRAQVLLVTSYAINSTTRH